MVFILSFSIIRVKNNRGGICNLLLAGCLLISGLGHAQTVEDFRVWGNVTTITDLSAISPRLERFYSWLEGQGRFRDGVDALDQGLLRGGFGYGLTESTTLWVGYAYIPTHPQGKDAFEEHRIWQQLLWTEQAGPVTVTSRTRLEQRFVESSDTTGWRVREFIRLAFPPLLPYGIRKEHPEYPEALRSISLVGWNEVFVQLNDSGRTASGFEQNRAFIGLGSKLNEHTRVEVGYLNQLIKATPENKMNHILSVNLSLKF
jgi:hypothetical protein